MTASERRIDHLVLAVHDLDAAAAFYERLGFQVGARNRHPWGTENRLIQFRSSFLELITIGDDPSRIPPHRPGHFSFGAFVRDFLERREGLAMFVLDSADAKADALSFAQAGIGHFEPFFFERKGWRPNGTETHVAFTLAFAMDPRLPHASFFVCQQHHPEAFWNPAFQQHPNGSSDVHSVTLGVAQPGDHAAFARAFTGASGTRESGKALAFPLRNGGRLRIARQPDAAGFTRFSVTVPDLCVVSERLNRLGIPFKAASGAIMALQTEAHGTAIEFIVSDVQAQDARPVQNSAPSNDRFHKLNFRWH